MIVIVIMKSGILEMAGAPAKNEGGIVYFPEVRSEPVISRIFYN